MCSVCCCSVRLAPRATHTTCLDVADIEGAHPCTRDRAHVFAACKAASAPAAAQQEAAQAVLAGLQLNQRQLLQLWDECSRLDRDKSGLVTGEPVGWLQCCCMLLWWPVAVHILQPSNSCTVLQKICSRLPGLSC
jgi:hypothetical protein